MAQGLSRTEPGAIRQSILQYQGETESSGRVVVSGPETALCLRPKVPLPQYMRANSVCSGAALFARAWRERTHGLGPSLTPQKYAHTSSGRAYSNLTANRHFYALKGLHCRLLQVFSQCAKLQGTGCYTNLLVGFSNESPLLYA